MNLLHMSNRHVLLHVEAAIEASPDVQSELRAILNEPNWRIAQMAAAGIVMVGADAATLTALWARLDRGSWVHPQLMVAALLRDPDCAERVRERLAQQMPPGRGSIRESLDWADAVGRDERALTQAATQGISLPAHRWMTGLRKHAPPDIQQHWLQLGRFEPR